MKIINKRNTLIFVTSFLIVTTPLASTFIDEVSPPVTELTSLTNEWTESCQSNAGWGISDTKMYCFSLWQSIDSYTKELN